ncbi:MAG: nuclear transport factor 2 family protein [Thermomicrobiales bacterium]|nr:nuclear transport factor 2 family protein [Thermomicrobiales bacterium]
MDRDEAQPDPLATAERLGREFFAAIDARDPHRLRAILANHATFRPLPHRDVVRPADDIVAYFGTVVSSYPTGRWDVTDVIASDDRAVVQFIVREYAPHLGRELISEQIAVFRTSEGRIVSIVGYYDSAEFRRSFWDDAMP